MPAMKKTLIQLVQDISSAVDDEPIESLSGTLAAEQMAQIVEEVFYDIVSYELPEHKEFLKLEAASDLDFPTHFKYPVNSTDIEMLWYDRTKALVGVGEYAEVCYLSPMEFVQRMDGISTTATNYVTVNDKKAGTKLRIQTDDFPRYWTSFDDEWIVMDAVNKSYDDTLQEHKSRAYGRVYPEFDRFDEGYIPDMDEEYHQVLFHESVARFMDRYKGGVSQKVEQSARRARYWIQDDKFRKTKPNSWSRYGRHG